ncbi:MAG: hypothetical protein EU551_00720 [Promethearchaeota archaeon]|nr:MAG: hypothetical protein EU551_00720 [Candidatus Lokiarchaeota archaeon]
MRKIKLFDIASILLLIVNVSLIAFGLIYAIRGELMPYHLEYLGITPAEIISFNPTLLNFANMSIRLVGFLFLSCGVIFVIVWYVGFRKKLKWAFLAILVSGSLIIIPLFLVILTVAGFNFPFPIGLICLILWIVSMVISGFEIFILGKK